METTLFKLTDPFGKAPSRPPFAQAVSTGVAWNHLPVTRDYTLGQLLDQTVARCGPQDALVYADRDTAGPGVQQLAGIIQERTAKTCAAAERSGVQLTSLGTTA